MGGKVIKITKGPKQLIELGETDASVVLVELDPQSEATLVDSSKKLNLTIRLGQGATLNHVRVMKADGTLTVHAGRDSNYTTQVIALGTQNSTSQYLLEGSGASVDISGLFQGKNQEKNIQNLEIRHLAPNAQSECTFHGIFDDESTGVFTGKIVVSPEAPKTAAHLMSRNLLLSPKASVSPSPELEIDNDDVKCAHGATVGQLDEIALFYLKSRGLTAERSEELLLEAFRAEIFEKIKEEPLRKWAENACSRY